MPLFDSVKKKILQSVFKEFMVPMRIVWLYCLSEYHSYKLCLLIFLSQEEDSVSSYLFNFATECAIEMVQKSRWDWNWMGHINYYLVLMMPIYWQISRIGWIRQKLCTSINDVGLRVSEEKSKFILVSCDQNPGKSHVIQTAKMMNGVVWDVTLCGSCKN
jgi:hypothetical protein